MKKLLSFDPKAPDSLRQTQIWFGNVIGKPLVEGDHINAIAPSGVPIEKEALQYIAPSPSLKPFERIQIYNQQYWWRLINVLQDSYPFLLRLFGYEGFRSEIVIPFLIDHPPDHWSINQMGCGLPGWIRKNYKAKDRKLTLNASLLDYHYHQLLYHPIVSSIQLSSNIGELMTLKLKLQPHISLHRFPYDLFSYRSAFMKESVEYWEENPFPKLKLETCYGILRRSSKDYIGWSLVSFAEYEVLKKIQRGISIEDLSEWLESEASEVSLAAAENLQKWFKNWSMKGYLIDANSKRSCISRSPRSVRKKREN